MNTGRHCGGQRESDCLPLNKRLGEEMQSENKDGSVKKVLHLTLKKKWFGMIASGLKGYEFREDKPHWRSRLVNLDGSLRDFDEIHFRLGYGESVPFMRVEFMTIHRLCREKAERFAVHGEDVKAGQFVICLGKVIEVQRWNGAAAAGDIEYKVAGEWKAGEFSNMRSGRDRRCGQDRRKNGDRRGVADRRAS